MEGGDSLRAAAAGWSLAGDKQLLDILQNIHKNIITKCQETNTKLDEMVSALDNASIDLQNVNNKFMALSNSQFIESRVYDDDTDVVTDNTPKEAPKPVANTDSEVSRLKMCVQTLECSHEAVTILDSDSESDDEGGRMVLRPRDIYAARPLPFIIGSQQWKNKWHAGLVAESDSESSGSRVPSEQYSESESEPEVELVTNVMKPPVLIPQAQEIESAASSLVPEVRASRPAAAGPPRPPRPHTPELPEPEAEDFSTPSPAPTNVYRPQQLPPATIFSNEPPPLDTTLSDSEDDDIFAELHKKPNTAFGGPRADVDLLFGAGYEEPPPLPTKRSIFEDEPQLEPEESPQPVHITTKPVEPEVGVVKKPIGGISLFGGKNAESIGAAILKRNRRKSSSDDESASEKNDTPNDVAPKPEPKMEVNKEKEILEEIFTKPKVKQKNIKDKPSIVKEIKEPVKKEKDLFSDIFDDIDDIFTSNVSVTKSSREQTKPLFDDDDLFADITKDSKVSKETKVKTNLFDSDDDLFSEVKVKSDTKPTQQSNKKKSILSTSKSIFDDSDDDIFTGTACKDTSKIDSKVVNEVENKQGNLVPKTSDVPPKIDKPKQSVKQQPKNISLFGDDEASDDLFKVETKIKVSKNQNVFHDEDEDIFSNNEKTSIINVKTNNEESKIKVNKKENIFDDDDNDDENIFTSNEKTSVIKQKASIDNDKHESTETLNNNITKYPKPTNEKVIAETKNKSEIDLAKRREDLTKANLRSINIEPNLDKHIKGKVETKISAVAKYNIEPKEPTIIERTNATKSDLNDMIIEHRDISKTENIIKKTESVVKESNVSKPKPPILEKCSNKTNLVIPHKKLQGNTKLNSAIKEEIQISKPDKEKGLDSIFDEEISHESILNKDNLPKVGEEKGLHSAIKEEKAVNSLLKNDVDIAKSNEDKGLHSVLNEDIDGDPLINNVQTPNQNKEKEKKSLKNEEKKEDSTCKKDIEIPKPDTEKELHSVFDENSDEEDSTFKNDFQIPKTDIDPKADIFSDIFNDLPPDFEKPKEPKKSKNINALFDDDSDDESFFKKNDVVTDEKPDFNPGTEDTLFRIFHDEPPAIDIDFVQKTNPEAEIDDLFMSQARPNSGLENDLFSTMPSVDQDLKPEDIDDLFTTKDNLPKSESSKAKSQFNSEVKQFVESKLFEKPSDSDDDLFNSVKSEPIQTKSLESESLESKKVGKLKPMSFNINVNTLLPGASPKKTKAVEEIDGLSSSIHSKAEDSELVDKPLEPEDNKLKSVTFNSDPSILDNKLSKERAKIQVKRRPSTRRARREAVRKSAIDYDSTDNSSSIDDPPKSDVINDIRDVTVKTSDVQSEEKKMINDKSIDCDVTDSSPTKNVNSVVIEPSNIVFDDNKVNSVDESNLNIKIDTEINKKEIIDNDPSQTAEINNPSKLAEDANKNSQKGINTIHAADLASSDVTNVPDVNRSTQTVKSKIVYILNDEDIFSDTKPVINKTKVKDKNDIFSDILDDDDDDLFKSSKLTPKVVKATSTSKDTKKDVSNDKDVKKDKDRNVLRDKKKSVFDDLNEEELFGSKKTIQKNVPDTKQETSNKSKESAVEKKEKVEVKSSLFGDDSDDELFRVKKTSDTKTNKPKEASPKPAEPVFEDPLSLLNEDGF